jgi:acyl dehydratase
MKMVDFLKENQQKARQVQTELVDKFEPKWRHLSTTMNKKLNDALTSPWGQQYLHFFDAEQQKKQQWLTDSPQLNDIYKQLHETLGEETFIGNWLTIEQSRIDQFAETTGDKQWIHVDPQRAKRESPYKSTVAHGFLTLSLLPTLTETVDTSCSEKYNARMIVNYGLNKVRFPYPVKEGARVRARSRLMHIDVLSKSTLELVREIKVEVEGKSRPACVAETVIRVYF